MSLRKIASDLRLVCSLVCIGACLTAPRLALASEYHGQVTFGGLPVPGATITATQGGRKFVAISDQQGSYSFLDLPDGAWKIEVEMQCFSTIEQTVAIAPHAPAAKFTIAPAFGNNRTGKKSLYTGGLAVILGNSALDARPYSLSGQTAPKIRST
jgi:hypothetical protein